MCKPQHSRSRPKGEERIWNVCVTKEDCGLYKPLDGFDMAAIRNKITELYIVRKQLLLTMRRTTTSGSITTVGEERANLSSIVYL